MISTVFFGTREFAAKMLQALIDSGDFEILLVITQPDRPVGRKQEIEKPAVKIIAEERGLLVAQPANKRGIVLPKSYELNIICQYGLIIPKNVLDRPKHGSINVHPSLLPKYRGASPIQSALINGETKTGASVILMDEKMDHGPILAQEEITIAPDDNFAALSAKLADVCSRLLITTAKERVAGKNASKAQDESLATYCETLTREDGKIDFNKSADEIYNQWRGLHPWPGVWAVWEGKRLKFIQLLPLQEGGQGWGLKPNEVKVTKNKIIIGCGRGSLEIHELQLEGKKPMDAAAFINGYGRINGALLE